MGKRQRVTYLVGVSDEELLELLEDPNLPERVRQDVVAELKFRGLRNRAKRRGQGKRRS